jgi:hypothetical protein
VATQIAAIERKKHRKNPTKKPWENELPTAT